MGQDRLKYTMTQYIFKRSQRARNLRITVKRDLKVVVTVPFFFSIGRAEKFLLEKKNWVEKSLARFVRRQKERTPLVVGGSYKKFKEKARIFVYQKLEEINKNYGFKYNRISIRKQKTRWGSCSRKGNLNFNYKIFFLPLSLAEYIVTHELCHLKEMNHSGRFWRLVGQTVPDYANLRKKLRKLAVI